jgi:alanine racemase
MTPTDPPAPPPDVADGAMAVLEIDLAAIAENWRRLRDAHGGRPTSAVVKADAYGTGAAQVAPHLAAAGCRDFFVAHLDEAIALRELLPDITIGVLNGPVPGTEHHHVEHAIDPVLGSLDDVTRWAALARKLGRRLPALLHLDTGINRLGLSAAEAAVLAEEPQRLDGIALRHVMTHFVSAEVPDDPLNAEQVRRFDALRARLPAAPTSLASSAGIYLGEIARSDLARPGVSLYGGNPTPGPENPMRPVLRLRARVLQVRDLAVGETVGYNATWRAARPSRVAVVGVGYADGWPRGLSNRGRAAFAGIPLPLAGRVSMDLSAYDVTDAPRIRPGDWLDLIGPHTSLERIAAEGQTTPYELLTRLGRRYARVWRA